MRLTTVLRKAAKAANDNNITGSRRNIKSLALSVYFKHPDLGMKDYEILTRASAFLLAVDPKEPEKSDEEKKNPYGHLEESIEKRKIEKLKQSFSFEPAGGPRRDVKDLGWLEFCPKTFRPIVHVVASSHVLAPWKWPNYYPQDWLSQIELKHCAYSLEVFDPTAKHSNGEALAKFACNPYPIHHPDGRDIALIHLKQEEATLKQLKKLGVNFQYLRGDNDNGWDNMDVTFDGFNIIAEDESEQNIAGKSTDSSSDVHEDIRIFQPYTEYGQIIGGNKDRFLATTPKPLPEGLCGGPTFDPDGNVCGMVEGIVPTEHENKQLAGAASFIPSLLISDFINHAEEIMLRAIVPDGLFKKIEDLKQNGELGGDQSQYDLTDVKENADSEAKATLAYDEMVRRMKESTSMEDADFILDTVRRERDEVVDILEREGGDIDDIIRRVRQKTLESEQEQLIKRAKEEGIDVDTALQGDGPQEAEIVSEKTSNSGNK